MNKKTIDYNLKQLTNLAVKDVLSHAILLIGDLDIGYVIAKTFAKFLLCNVSLKNIKINNHDLNIVCDCSACKIFSANGHPDYFLIDLGVDQEIKIDIIREANNFVNTSGYLANRKVVLINNFHNINNQAANALLKTLEEPSLTTQILFLLIADNHNSLPATILSRVLQFNVFNAQINNNQEYKRSEILQDLYNIWVQDTGNISNIIEKWQLLPKQQLINCLWFIMTNIIKTATNSLFLEIKGKISPELPWQLLDSLNYINKLINLGYQVNWQLFLYNFILTKFTGENVYVRRAKF